MRYIFQIQIKGFATLAGTAFLSDPISTYVIYSKGLQTGKKSGSIKGKVGDCGYFFGQAADILHPLTTAKENTKLLAPDDDIFVSSKVWVTANVIDLVTSGRF
jgi:hypothetical protein